MNADQLLAHYEQVADAPDAIPRLRRFILDLAVRGKLVEQDPADEPASELLKRVEAEKARLVNAGKIRKKAASDPIMVDAPFDLPRNWAWVSIGTAFLYDAGAKRGPKALDQSLWLLELENIEKDTGRLVLRVRSAEGASQSTKSEFLPGDILYGKLRPYLNKVLVADEPGYSTTEIVAIRPYLPLCSEYCALALRRPDFVKYVTRLGQGTKMPRLRTEDAVVAPFPLPPLAEQHRIVAKVDELMALCDRLEAARADREATRDRLTAASLVRLNAPDPDPAIFRVHTAFALENLAPLTTRLDQIKVLRQTILILAVRGKLVEQDPNDEPASELLKRITSIRVGKSRRKSSFAEVTEDEKSFDFLLGWKWSRFGEVFSIRTGFAFKSSTYSNSGVLVFRVVNFDRSGGFDFTDIKHFPEKLIDEKISKFSLQEGEILMVMVGGTIGKTTRVVPEILPALLNQNMWRIRSFGKAMLNDFEYLLIRVLNQQIENLTNSTHGHFAMSDYEQKPVCIPPLAEQHRIVSKVDQLMALCDLLEASLATATTTRARLLEALLHEALGPAEEREAAA